MARGGSRTGAGRPGWRRKCEHSIALDIRDLQRRQLLRPGHRFQWTLTTTLGDPAGSVGITAYDWSLTLSYPWTPPGGDPQRIECELRFARTPCNYGGTRPWFICPKCHGRCAVAYFSRARGQYACRKCLNLAYKSESLSPLDRLWRKQAKLEGRLGPDREKPKGMQWRTVDRIDDQLARIESRKGALFGSRFGLLTG